MLTLLALALTLAQAPALDSDGDGLSDFHERHKYGTDPRSADSDGDGVADGDADERREWTYTVRTIVQVVPPLVTDDVLCDDWQDARVLDRTDEYVELEVIHYPLGTANDAIEADPHWREHTAGLEAWLAPGPTSNWDAELRDALVRALAADGIDVDALDDRALVERASRWLCAHARSEDGFTTFQCELVDGEVRPHPLLRAKAEREARELGRTLDEQWQRELFAKGMFENGVRGSCTSSATYLNGCLRALGIPTRIVLAVPLVDATDARELELVARLRHPKVRRIALDAALERPASWASHTFNEVWVGGRWRRLNYERLGQGILDPSLFGMITHVATLNDWLDDGMATRFGLRQARRDAQARAPDAFGFANPYSTIALSDRFGAHSGLSPETAVDDELLRAPPAGEDGAFEPLTELAIDSAVWSDAPDSPAGQLRDMGTVLLLRVGDRQDFPRHKRFTVECDRRFRLEAPNLAPLEVSCAVGGLTNDSGSYLVVRPPQGGWALVDGAGYRLVPVNGSATRHWSVAERIVVRR